MNDPILFAGSIDVAEMSFYLFALFFLGLVIWLRREDRREGYPLETDVGGRLLHNDGLLQQASPKTFHLPFDQGEVVAPRADDREPVDVPNARRTGPFSGSAIEPVGDPIGAGVGPGAKAQRAKFADVTFEGLPRIVPIGDVPGMAFDARDGSPVGKTVYGADDAAAGTVTDAWVDRSEFMIRYLEVDTGARRVLMPMMMAIVKKDKVTCSALTGAQFADAPATPAGTITRDEEEHVVSYFGGGYLYATPERQEPLI
jgi:photosynthetic reaction center H subunit